MKKKVHPSLTRRKNRRSDDLLLGGSYPFSWSGRVIETGEVSSNNVAGQTRVPLDKIRLAVEEAGSAIEHIVKMTIYLRDMSDYQAMRDAEFGYYQEYCPSLVEDPPASTVVQVVSLSKPNMLSIDAIAHFPDSGMFFKYRKDGTVVRCVHCRRHDNTKIQRRSNPPKANIPPKVLYSVLPSSF